MPLFGEETGEFIDFAGWSKNAARLNKVNIIEVKAPKLGYSHPSEIVCELEISFDKMPDSVIEDWKLVNEYSALFLVGLGKNWDSEEFKD
jgi:hypothetical protein